MKHLHVLKEALEELALRNDSLLQIVDDFPAIVIFAEASSKYFPSEWKILSLSIFLNNSERLIRFISIGTSGCPSLKLLTILA